MPTDLSGASATDVLELAEAQQVRFLRLQFTDILGVIKNVEIPSTQFRKALHGDIMFDGSSIEGFVRVEESDKSEQCSRAADTDADDVQSFHQHCRRGVFYSNHVAWAKAKI